MNKPPSESAGPGWQDSVGLQTPPGGEPRAIRPLPHIPEHELIELIGSGAYGEVWLARNVVGTLRAVKVVYRQNFSEAYPFEREFKGIQRFEPVSRSHDGLMDILQIGRDEEAGYFYCVMELADNASPVQETSSGGAELPAPKEGLPPNRLKTTLQTYTPRTLRQDLKQRGRLPAAECVRVALGLCGGLEHLHAQGLVHRDLKPSNIIFVGGAPKLADIGLVADVAEARSFVGTAGYIPPEGPGTAQADLYSLGKVLYEMLTGKDRNQYPDLPSDLKEWPEVREAQELNQVILKACEDDPGRRYHSAAQMRRDLALLEQGRSVQRRHQAASMFKSAARWAAVLAVAAAGLWTAVSLAKREPPAPAPLVAEKASIFVLPFRHAGTNVVLEDLRGRIADAFIDSLGLIEGVRVGPRKSAWVRKDEAEVRREAAKLFNVRHLLAGTVATPPGRVRIEARLYEAGQDRPLWSETFAGASNEVVEVEKRVLARVAGTLGLKISATEEANIHRKLTNNLAALHLSRQAMVSWMWLTKAGYARALELYDRALQLDPLYLEADAAAAYVIRYFAQERAPFESWPLVRDRALKVLRVDDTHWMGRYGHMAVVWHYDQDWEAADRSYADLMKDQPDGAARSFNLAYYLGNVGHLDLAWKEWMKAERTDPEFFKAVVPSTIRGWMRWAVGRYEEGMQVCREGLRLHPRVPDYYISLAYNAVGARQYDEAIAAAQKCLEVEDQQLTLSLVGYASALKGDRSKATNVLQELERRSRDHYVQTYFMARIHAALGEKEEALQDLETAVADRTEYVMHLGAYGNLLLDPAWVNLRQEPRFQAMVKKVGLLPWPKPTAVR